MRRPGLGAAPEGRAPLLGKHNLDILCGRLGFSIKEAARSARESVTNASRAMPGSVKLRAYEQEVQEDSEEKGQE